MLVNVLTAVDSFTRLELAETWLSQMDEDSVDIDSPNKNAGTVINETAIPSEFLNQFDNGDFSRNQVIANTEHAARATMIAIN
ncbi:hypothetical protein A4F89_08920 [Polynucleobacter asymbioticus]|uniref:Uncharacterized protein n=1 Tax=Polynucleobacter asymbioticus TaxID=576611 RepID=A0AAC9NJ86_9BURK|nr:hypothetical protein A4F89_08920 [Polynucleobacter asymbioticus]APC01754.1 hypothetical protein AOC25_09055 [Polynucleobacter asymbioticus]